MNYPVEKSDEQWREELTDFEYHVLREAGTADVGLNFSPVRVNLILTVAGQVFMNQKPVTRSSSLKIEALAWFAPKFDAQTAEAT